LENIFIVLRKLVYSEENVDVERSSAVSVNILSSLCQKEAHRYPKERPIGIGPFSGSAKKGQKQH